MDENVPIKIGDELVEDPQIRRVLLLVLHLINQRGGDAVADVISRLLVDNENGFDPDARLVRHRDRIPDRPTEEELNEILNCSAATGPTRKKQTAGPKHKPPPTVGISDLRKAGRIPYNFWDDGSTGDGSTGRDFIWDGGSDGSTRRDLEKDEQNQGNHEDDGDAGAGMV